MPLRIFPVARVADVSFTSSFGAPRSGGRSHEGNDIMAPDGTPLFAVDDGEARFGTDPLGGNIVNLFAPDGTRYYYAHLQAFENASPGMRRTVRAGETLGTVGRTGNAATTPPHVHFEVHPGNGPAVDPFPLLTGAEQRAPGRSILPWLLALGLAGGAAYVAVYGMPGQRGRRPLLQQLRQAF